MQDDRERRVLDETARFLAEDDPVLAWHLTRFTRPPGARTGRGSPRSPRALPGWAVVSILLVVAVFLLALPAVVSPREPLPAPGMTYEAPLSSRPAAGRCPVAVVTPAALPARPRALGGAGNHVGSLQAGTV